MKRSCSAASEVFSFIIVLLITSGLITSLTVWGVPYMEEKKASARLDSSLLQFDALDNLIEDCISQFVGDESDKKITSSKTMNFVMESGQLSFVKNTERIVIYASLYDWTDDEGLKNAFWFDVWGVTEDEFSIGNIKHKEFSGGLQIRYDFILKDISGNVKDRIDDVDIQDTLIIMFQDQLKDAVKVEIYLGPPDGEDLVGIIFIFDLNSIIYEDSNVNGIYKAIVQSGAVISSKPRSNAYFFNEPSHWQTTLLDGSKIFNFRIIDIKENPNYNITNVGGSTATELKFFISSNASIIDSDFLKIPFFNFLKIKFYGNKQIVDAWRFFYKFNYDFEYFEDFFEGKKEFGVKYELEEKPLKNLLSMNYVKCDFGMGVVS